MHGVHVQPNVATVSGAQNVEDMTHVGKSTWALEESLEKV